MLVKKRKKKSPGGLMAALPLLCFCQRVEELEKENALLKSEKEEMNQIILQQSLSSAGEI